MKIYIYENRSQLSEPGKFIREGLVDLWDSRHLAFTLASRDIKAKFRQTWLGVVWALLPPVATTAMFVILQSQDILSPGVHKVPYPVFTMAGIILWQLFSEAVIAPLQVIHSSRTLIARVLFPREALLPSGLAQIIFNLVRLDTSGYDLFCAGRHVRFNNVGDLNWSASCSCRNTI